MDNFQEQRRKGIGGTDMGAILGINPYKTAYQVYLEKVEGHHEDLSDNEAVVWGSLLEDAIAARYVEVTKKSLACYIRCDKVPTVFHPEFPYLMANPDRIIEIGASGMWIETETKGRLSDIPTSEIIKKFKEAGVQYEGLEIKTVGYQSAHLWGESGSSQIPEHYYTQIAHYMLVCELPIWNVAALIGGQELRTYRFERDSEFDGYLLEAGTKFWKEHVEKKVPPPIDYSHRGAQEFIKRRYKAISEEVVELPEEFLSVKDKFLECKKEARHWAALANEAQTIILEQMKNAGVAHLSDGSRFIRKLIKSKEYTVPEREYIRLDFKGNEGEERC